MAFDRTLACRLEKASLVTYAVDQPGGITTSPWYASIGFIDVPDVVIGGVDRIDAAFVGSCVDCVIVAFRGTLPLVFDSGPDTFFQSLYDWLNDIRAIPVPGYGGMVHGGFTESLEDLWPGLEPKIQARAGAGTRIYVTGHSKGGALAFLAAVRLSDGPGLAPVAVYTYAAPRAGNGDFVDHYDQTIAETWRVENRDDLIPHLPPGGTLWLLLRRLDPRFTRLVPFEYESAGTLQFIDWSDHIVNDSLLLEIERAESLTEKLVTGQLATIAADHVATGNYLTALCPP
jgi:hypothetical protein